MTTAIATRWWCEDCKARGVVDHEPDAGVWEVLTTIEDLHQKTAPDCHREHALELVRVELVTATTKEDS